MHPSTRCAALCQVGSARGNSRCSPSACNHFSCLCLLCTAQAVVCPSADGTLWYALTCASLCECFRKQTCGARSLRRHSRRQTRWVASRHPLPLLSYKLARRASRHAVAPCTSWRASVWCKLGCAARRRSVSGYMQHASLMSLRMGMRHACSQVCYFPVVSNLDGVA